MHLVIVVQFQLAGPYFCCKVNPTNYSQSLTVANLRKMGCSSSAYQPKCIYLDINGRIQKVFVHSFLVCTYYLYPFTFASK